MVEVVLIERTSVFRLMLVPPAEEGKYITYRLNSGDFHTDSVRSIATGHRGDDVTGRSDYWFATRVHAWMASSRAFDVEPAMSERGNRC